MARKKVVAVFGTRPEAIKMAPVVYALSHAGGIDAKVCSTGQHREMLDQALKIFGIKPNTDLDLMTQNQTLSSLTSTLIARLSAYYEQEKPDLVLVHGDTTTSFAASLVGFYTGIPVGHVEAGLRTFDLTAPFPEEFNRRVTGILAKYHFSPTEKARGNLLAEGVAPERVFVTGNTIVDALYHIKSNLFKNDSVIEPLRKRYPILESKKPTILLTTHRRENFGSGLESICDAVLEVLERNPDFSLIFPVHLNPRVRDIVFSRLRQEQLKDRVMLIDPVDYIELVYILSKCSFVLTDSGGLQEEAPSFGKYVFVLREKTERPEACEAGLAELVGTDKTLIVNRVQAHIERLRHGELRSMDLNPYGDGQASQRIADIVCNQLNATNS